MAALELHCPRCNSPEIEKGEGDKYRCDHCKSEFILIDLSSKKITHETKRHYCPNCGRPVKAEDAHRCVLCGKEDLCVECIELASNKVLCSDCLKKEVSKSFRCVVCGQQTTNDSNGDIDFWNTFENERGEFVPVCLKCKGEVCNNCVIEEGDSTDNYSLRCKKCGSELSFNEYEDLKVKFLSKSSTK